MGCDIVRHYASQYDWDIETVVQVAQAESGCNTGSVNDNPSTGDYSIGLMQINLYGSNALYRPNEQELKKPDINIAYAYKLYSDNGKSFIGQWGVCINKVKCY